ncbi:MAG: SPASM domain-containing protein [Raineya sp.]|nr:SPASM domain-containing protein [Raineya sp.]
MKNWNWNLFSQKRKNLSLWWQSKHLRLEISSKCQLKCPLCFTGTGYHRKYSAIGWGNLDIEQFRDFLEKNPQIQSLELSNYGELFLHPQIEKILRMAYEKNIQLTILNGTNLNYLPDRVAEALVKYQVVKIKVSIDGASQQSYQQYRVGGNLEKVLNHIRKINFYKEKYQSRYPKLKWQFIVFGHNEHEIEKAQALAQELQMSFKLKFNYSPKKFPVRNRQILAQKMGYADITEFEEKNQIFYSPACFQLWTAPQINWDGKLLGCCVNYFGDFGNVFQEGLENLLQSERYIYAKKMLLGEVPARSDIPCVRCKRYEKVLQMPFCEQLEAHLKAQQF